MLLYFHLPTKCFSCPLKLFVFQLHRSYKFFSVFIEPCFSWFFFLLFLLIFILKQQVGEFANANDVNLITCSDYSYVILYILILHYSLYSNVRITEKLPCVVRHWDGLFSSRFCGLCICRRLIWFAWSSFWFRTTTLLRMWSWNQTKKNKSNRFTIENAIKWK